MSQISEDSPKAQALYDKIVLGALAEIMPETTPQALFELLEKPDVEH